ncbi:MAG TPA: hypothetical protein VK715_04615 [Steroidobacteraceae bacterium]|nr:hypothetical protein [Steroidobacteraceae bacterium]
MVSAWDSLHSATLELVRSTPIKQRLIAAYRRHLSLIDQEQLPAEARGSFAQVMRSLAGVPPLRGEDAVTASVRKMSSQEADDCAALIVELLGMLSRTADGATTQRPSAAVVQLRSVDCEPSGFDVNSLIATN